MRLCLLLWIISLWFRSRYFLLFSWNLIFLSSFCRDDIGHWDKTNEGTSALIFEREWLIIDSYSLFCISLSELCPFLLKLLIFFFLNFTSGEIIGHWTKPNERTGAQAFCRSVILFYPKFILENYVWIAHICSSFFSERFRWYHNISFLP